MADQLELVSVGILKEARGGRAGLETALATGQDPGLPSLALPLELVQSDLERQMAEGRLRWGMTIEPVLGGYMPRVIEHREELRVPVAPERRVQRLIVSSPPASGFMPRSWHASDKNLKPGISR